MLEAYAPQSRGDQTVAYDGIQIRLPRVPTWPHINPVSPGGVSPSDYNMNMNMFPNGQTSYFPRSNSTSSMGHLMIPMTPPGVVPLTSPRVPMTPPTVVQGNVEHPTMFGYPHNMNTGQYAPAQFTNQPYNSYDNPALYSQPSGWHQPFQAQPYNQTYNQQNSTPVPYPHLQQTLIYETGERPKNNGKNLKTKKGKESSLTSKCKSETSPFLWQNIQQHIIFPNHVQRPHLVYDPNQLHGVPNNPNGKGIGEQVVRKVTVRKGIERSQKVLFMPTHRPRSPKERAGKNSEKHSKVRKPRKKRKVKTVGKILQTSKKDVRKSGKGVTKKPPIVKRKSIGARRMVSSSQTTSECLENDPEVQPEVSPQSFESDLTLSNPNERSPNISCATKPADAWPQTEKQPNSSSPLIDEPFSTPVAGSNTNQMSFPEKVANPEMEKADLWGERVVGMLSRVSIESNGEMYSPGGTPNEQGGVYMPYYSPKERTPAPQPVSSDLTTPGSTTKERRKSPMLFSILSTKSDARRTPAPLVEEMQLLVSLVKEKPFPDPCVKEISHPAPLVKKTLCPAPLIISIERKFPVVEVFSTRPDTKKSQERTPVLASERIPAPLVSSELQTHSLISEPSVRDGPWQTVKCPRKRRKYGVTPAATVVPEPEPLETLSSAKVERQVKVPKKPRRRKKKKKVRAQVIAKDDKEQGPQRSTPEKLSTDAGGPRKNSCDFMKECILEVFSWFKTKNN